MIVILSIGIYLLIGFLISCFSIRYDYKNSAYENAEKYLRFEEPMGMFILVILLWPVMITLTLFYWFFISTIKLVISFEDKERKHDDR